MKSKEPYNIKSISEYCHLLGLEKPKHPLIGLINHEDIKNYNDEKIKYKVYNFYTISRKIKYDGTMKYGQHFYDFDEGVLVFHGPKQVIVSDLADNVSLQGWTLLIHPEFIRPYPLAAKLRQYGFFSYHVHEALHLSGDESEIIEDIMDTIRKEFNSAIDIFSQDILISQIELLLNYCNRFYNRQFITRKAINTDLLAQLEQMLSDYFNNNKSAVFGLPTVQYVSQALNVSPNYLSDLLRNLTGQNTQQFIHYYLIEKAKELLTISSLSVSEIAYQLGFEYTQSFSKLFKKNTMQTPLEYRHSFN